MRNIAVFASGNGSNFEAIAEDCAREGSLFRVAVCICDRPGAYVVQRAFRLGIPVMEVSPKLFASKEEYETHIAETLEDFDVQLICLAGYMRLVGKVLLERYEGRILNIHPSLLPAFKGAHAIRDAFDYGVTIYGVTVHLVDETLDGGRIIAQDAFPYEGKDFEQLESMVHQVEHRLYPAVLRKIGEGMGEDGFDGYREKEIQDSDKE